MNDFDWNQMRGFLATADSGSLSSAARKLSLTQPTLSRQVAALEAQLGVTLFERVGKNLVLTETGTALLAHARLMGQAADALGMAATGRSEIVEGLVSISATDAVATHFMPAALARIRHEAPGIRIEIIVSNALSDLRRREADIAIRHVRPKEPELFGKLIRQATARFYASGSWVAQNGMPVTAEDASGLLMLGIDRDEGFMRHLHGMGLKVTTANFPVFCENALVGWQMVRAGLCVGIMMDDIAATMDDLVPVLAAVGPVEFPIWLVTHRELHTSRRIRIVFDILAETLKVGV